MILKYKNTRVTYNNNNNNGILLFYSITLAKLLTYDYASIYYKTTYANVNKDNKAINN